jgi:hypothetical protein
VRDSVRILLTVEALNELDILGADVQNAFLTAPSKEKCWMIAGPEFGPEEGKAFLVVKPLYGLKSASFSFRSFMAHTDYIIFLNRSPIIWYSKRQQTAETSTFSAEFIALKVCLEAIEHLRFKLRCFGVPMPQGEPTYAYCDNESVVKNTTNVESTLNEKHSSMAYHHCRWSMAAGVITLAHISAHENLTDCFTKQLSVHTRNYLFGNWTY